MNEAIKIYKNIEKYINNGNGIGIDIGCGPYKILNSKNCIGIDPNCGDIKLNAEEYLKFIESDSIDWVFTSHFLEHTLYYEDIIKNVYRILRKDGFFIVYLPDKNVYVNKNGDDPNSEHVNRWSLETFQTILKKFNFSIIESENRNTTPKNYFFTGNGHTEDPNCQNWEYSFLIICKK